jgi:hypothetical protein
MKVVVCDKKEIYLMDGRKVAGDVVDIPDKIALRYLAHGAVERYETKVIRETPFAEAGAEEQSSASPADQASPETTAKPSAGGETVNQNFVINGESDRLTTEQIAKRRRKKRSSQ